ncbi:cyclin-domain-containing protein [Aaosphaeria arxii CBS 175.79]|uniref:Cyclin-domain-containing protein n=1 Tax=Aaosphaeria arxii CBS 175.79 TaxID=1450172 RepID=A0A6A5XV32_9PLEO|nr:cyclin-domain-containing protein [Aaosphaeria arxii CBS 175.79]KAF2016571.1 cyclin-domain-containing protein [Aaosphaeria arxii CBS 175.79]
MLTSSPTISAPSSPSATFHTHARSYHASRRTSSSITAPSPRFLPQVTASSPRRSDQQQQNNTNNTNNNSVASVHILTRSPRIRKREYEYTDSGTQYTPPDYPPTYRPQAAQKLPAIDLPAAPTSVPSPRTQAEIIPATAEQRASSAQAEVTEPPEPQLRIDPQPPATPQQQQQQTSRSARKTPKEIPRSNDLSDDAQDEPERGVETPLSPAKRSRPQNPNVKVMPLKYETCDVKDLGILISDMLMELVRLNDGFPLRDGQLTRFHSRAPPGISVRDYLFRLIAHATLSPPILLSMVFYVDKLCTMYPAFTISSLTVHRFLITAATVAAKGLSDSFWTNSLYAKVGGVSLRELALLELEFLRKLDWRIVPKPETLVDYYKGLVERGEGYVMEKESESSPASSPTLPSQQQTNLPSDGSKVADPLNPA